MSVSHKSNGKFLCKKKALREEIWEITWEKKVMGRDLGNNLGKKTMGRYLGNNLGNKLRRDLGNNLGNKLSWKRKKKSRRSEDLDNVLGDMLHDA